MNLRLSPTHCPRQEQKSREPQGWSRSSSSSEHGHREALVFLQCSPMQASCISLIASRETQFLCQGASALMLCPVSRSDCGGVEHSCPKDCGQLDSWHIRAVGQELASQPLPGEGAEEASSGAFSAHNHLLSVDSVDQVCGCFCMPGH